MKKLFTIIILCLISTPVFAWEKFGGVITDTTIYPEESLEYEVFDTGLLTMINPDGTDLGDLREAIGLERELPYVESVPGIHVYESGYDESIGLLIGFDGFKIMVYLPDVESIFTIDSKTGAAQTAFIYYKTEDCTGAPFITSANQYSIIKACDNLYTGKRKQPRFFNAQSRIVIENGQCRCWANAFESYFVPAITVPGRVVGLYLPLALPLRFQAYSKPTY